MKITRSCTYILCALFTLNSCNTVNLSRKLVAHYPFNSNANDQGRNKLNGTVHGAELTTDRNNKPDAAYYFDGDDYIEVANNSFLNFNDNFTFAAWINMEEKKRMGSRIIDKSVGSTNYGFLLDTYSTDLTGDQIRFFCGDAWKYKSAARISVNQWYFIVATYKKGVGKIFINGELNSENSSKIKKIITSTTPMRFGFDTNVRQGQDFDDSFKGKIDDIRIYHRALSPAEIKSLYEN